MECKYCNRTFSHKNSLRLHQTTAKYCLAIQQRHADSLDMSTPSTTNPGCSGCGKAMSRQNLLKRHEEKCCAVSYVRGLMKEREEEMKAKEAELQDEMENNVQKRVDIYHRDRLGIVGTMNMKKLEPHREQFILPKDETLEMFIQILDTCIDFF